MLNFDMNPYIPTDCPFEIFGYWEEFSDLETGKSLGDRELAEPDRPVGSPGLKTIVLTKDLHLTKGMDRKPVKVRASRKYPRRISAIIQIKCGRVRRSDT